MPKVTASEDVGFALGLEVGLAEAFADIGANDARVSARLEDLSRSADKDSVAFIPPIRDADTEPLFVRDLICQRVAHALESALPCQDWTTDGSRW